VQEPTTAAIWGTPAALIVAWLKVNAGQVILQGNLLSPKMLFDRQRVVSAAFDRGVVGYNHTFATGNASKAGYQTGPRGFAVV
jgi:hypothetical protein